MANEVGSAYFTLLPSVKGLQGSIAKEVSGIDGKSAGDKIGRSMGGGIAGSLKSIVGPAIAAIGIGATFSFAKDAVASFSELEDSSAAAAVTFAGNMDRIEALSKTGASALGMNAQQVVNSAQMYGIFGKSAGLAGEDLESFAIDMTKLTGDLSSFSGKSVEDSITAVGAAMRGEFEPIRSFGVLLDDATLRQEALSMGLISTTKDALTPQQKTLAAQSAILKQTTDAQGDFARTSMSTANVAKTLAAESENVSAKLGSVLAPAFTAVRIKALDGVRGVSTLLDGVIAFRSTLAEGGSLTDAAVALGLPPGVAGVVGAVLGEVRGSYLAFWAGLREGGEVTSAGVSGMFEQLGVMLHDVFTGLAPVFSSLGTVFQSLAPMVLTLFQSFSPLGMIFKALMPVLPALANAVGLLVASLGLALSGALVTLLPVLTQLADVLVGSLGQIFVALAPMIVDMLGQIGVLFVQLAPVVADIIGILVTLAATLITQLMPIFMELVSSVMPMVMSIFMALVPAIIPLVQMIAGLLIPIIQALLPVVVAVFQTVANVIKSVMQIVMGIIQVVTGIISGNWAQVWEGMGNILSGVWNLIVSLIRGALQIVGQIVISGVQLAVSFATSAFQGLVGFLGGVWSNITNGVSGMIGNVVGFFSGLVGKITGALGNAGGILLQTGKDIIQGLINGISSMMGAIGRAVLSIVPEAIRGPFEDLLGIHSPSRVAIWWGHMIGGGLIDGLDDMVQPVAKATLGLFSMPDPAVAALATAGGRYAYDLDQGEYRSGPLVEQHVYPREEMSETNLANISAGKIIEELV